MLKKMIGVKYVEDLRQVGIIVVYMFLLFGMMFIPQMRHPVVVALACYFSFLNAVIIHNTMHMSPFLSRKRGAFWRWVISFGNLYPASANVPSHNMVHHTFDDAGQPDWATPDHVGFRWNLLNLVHFPNVAGPETFDGVSRWAKRRGKSRFRAEYRNEMIVAFGLTGIFLAIDPWTAILCVVVPQLYGARCILRINLIQHQGADTASTWNHSRNFVGRSFNWIMCNNGYHTIHHMKPHIHWAKLDSLHDSEIVPKIDPSLNEQSMVWYLLRTFGFGKLKGVLPARTIALSNKPKASHGVTSDLRS